MKKPRSKVKVICNSFLKCTSAACMHKRWHIVDEPCELKWCGPMGLVKCIKFRQLKQKEKLILAAEAL